MFKPRTQFPPHNVPLANFAGHHRKALADLKKMGPKLDLVLELRDSRAPLSTINPLISRALPGVPKITLYSKRDISKIKESLLLPVHDGNKEEFRMVDVDQRKYASRLLKDLKAIAGEQFPRPPLGFRVMVCGMPNAGKSTFINQIRRIVFGRNAKKVAFTGDKPGITRHVSEQIKVSWDPEIYVIDSPGVLVPQVYDWEQMIKLCLIGAVPRNLVDPVVLADYLLFKINLWYPTGGRYPGEPSNDIYEVLWNIANKSRRKPKKDEWDPNNTAVNWVDQFIRGGVCKLILDDLSPENVRSVLARVHSNA